MSVLADRASGAGVLDRLQVLRSAPTPLRGAPAATWPPSPRTGVRQLRVAGHDYDENRPSRLHLSNARSWSEEWGPPPMSSPRTPADAPLREEGEAGPSARRRAVPGPAKPRGAWARVHPHAHTVISVGLELTRAEQRQPLERGQELTHGGFLLDDLHLLDMSIHGARDAISAGQSVVSHTRRHRRAVDGPVEPERHRLP